MTDGSDGDWLGSAPLYTAMAGGYDASFREPSNRYVYDRVAGQFVARLLPASPGAIIDAGCGTGRWAEQWLSLGHRVIGIEQAPGMLEALKNRKFGNNFSLIADDMEAVELPPGSADLVIAMGSVQYARNPAAMIRRFTSWTRPGGFVCVYVDSLMALVLELIRMGKREEALIRLRTRRGIFRHGDYLAELHLYDRETLTAQFAAAGLTEIRCHGLLITSSAWGPQGCFQAMAADEDAFLDLEQSLFEFPGMADAGKHLIAAGRRP